MSGRAFALSGAMLCLFLSAAPRARAQVDDFAAARSAIRRFHSGMARRTADAGSDIARLTADAGKGAISVGIQEWKLQRLDAPGARSLSTHGIATCVGFGGLDRAGKRAFLAHFLYQDLDPRASLDEAAQGIAAIARAVGGREGFSRFELVLAGAGFYAGDFGKDIRSLLESEYGAVFRPGSVSFQGDWIRAISISLEGIRVEQERSRIAP